MHDRTRRDLEKKCRIEGRHNGNLVGLLKFSTCKFRRLRIFATLLPTFLLFTVFDPPFMVLYKSTLDVVLVPLDIFVIFLLLSTYISLVKLVTSINFKSINHSIKLGTKFPLLRLLCDFLSLSFTFLNFLTIQTPLNDDKSRDVRLKPSSLKGKATGGKFLGKLAVLLLFM